MPPQLTGTAAMMTLFAAALFASAAPVPAPEAKKADFYPLAKGNKWEMKVTVGTATVDMEQEVTKVVEVKGGNPQATLVSKNMGNPAASEVLSVDAKGVYRHSYNGVDISTPVTSIKLPHKAGTKWQEKFKLGDNEIEIEAEALEPENVKVGAGKYDTFPVRLTAMIMGEKMVSTQWFADGVGVVKQEAELGAISVKMELEKFTPAKK